MPEIEWALLARDAGVGKSGRLWAMDIIDTWMASEFPVALPGIHLLLSWVSDGPRVVPFEVLPVPVIAHPGMSAEIAADSWEQRPDGRWVKGIHLETGPIQAEAPGIIRFDIRSRGRDLYSIRLYVERLL